MPQNVWDWMGVALGLLVILAEGIFGIPATSWSLAVAEAVK